MGHVSEELGTSVGRRNRDRGRRSWTRSRLGVATLAMAAVVTAILAGCARVDLRVNVAEDGSTEFTIDVISDELVKAVPDELLQGSEADSLGPGTRTEPIERDGRKGMRIVFTTRNLGHANTFLLAGPDGAGIPFFESFTIDRPQEGVWTFNAVARDMPTVVRELTAEYPGAGDVPVWDGVWETADDGIYLTVALPGVVAETNAPESGHNSATWPVHEMAAGEPLMMVNEPEAFPTRTQRYIGAGVIAFIVLIVLISVVKGIRRRRSARESAAARAQYRQSMMAPAAWQEPGAGSWGVPGGVPGHTAPGALPADPNAVTFDPGTGRPLRGTGATESPLSEQHSITSTPPIHPGALMGVPPAPPVDPAAPVDPAPPADPASSAPVATRWAPPAADQIVRRSPGPEPVDGTPDVVPPEPAEPPPPGWHPDPLGIATYRWWTGTEWSEHTE